jgi:hypothetical protein
MSVAGMSFTVTGLNSASKYAYHLAVKDEEQKDLQAYNGEFATTGYVGEINEGGDPENNPDSLDEISSSLQGGDRGRLIYHEGKILILRDGKVYDLTGRKL